MFPIVIRRKLRGANATNWPGFVILDPDAPLQAAVLAQEAYEALHKLNPLNALRVRFSERYERRMEVMGHECEVQAAALIYGRDPVEYRAREVRSMRSGYGGLFDATTPQGLTAAMEAVSDEASRFVRRHKRKLERWK